MIERNQELLKEYMSNPVIGRLMKSGLQLSDNKEIALFICFKNSLANNKLDKGQERFKIDTYANLYPMCYTTQPIAEFHNPRESSYYFYFWDLYGWWYENLREKQVFGRRLGEESFSIRVKEGEDRYEHLLSITPLRFRIENERILDYLYTAGHMYRWDNEGLDLNFLFMEEPYYSAQDVAKRHEYERPLTAGCYEEHCKALMEKFRPQRT